MWMTAKVKDKSKDSFASAKSGRATGTAAVQPKKQGCNDFSKKPTSPKNDRKVENLVADRKTAMKPFTSRETPSPCPKCQEMH
ncbi:hypothetical protein PF005_g7567 [Phytophthora fragariae]|uniref:Uncharacterized protein n=1 Tax=Phytophthora fragariae TaxID=53985 RepID=A0A6A3UPK4_9STRA|nr:hypothetical protein PF003_g29456 [Phytophthora fragariae]KAE8942085.1 hypothetical protein PF009_g8142 [Phytophthora fragariae]KAE9018672.1 hypothetical protein PF011_g6162 [Phytophthora fragariae]KAE9121698.1 hypothetical protein PF007_g7725 [Phytophthora fragariae]KAE9122732.1 hypothetical protein PF010_g6642 [Phytophthora fragariae]